MDMQISLRVDKPRNPVRYMGSIPIYPMGDEISLVAEFTNKGANDMKIEDPKTSQKVLLWVLPEGEIEEDVFEINPGFIDITGERTAPISHDIVVPPQESTSISIQLYRYCFEGCFPPGKYEVYVEFLEITSHKIEYGVEFRPESVPKLVDIVLDEKSNPWIREQSLLWLQKLPKKPNIELPAEGETADGRKVRETRNRENAKLFLKSWPEEKETKIIRDFFEDMKLK